MFARESIIKSRWSGVALTLAIIIFWISGGATLLHSDDLGAFRTFHTGKSTITKALPATPDTLCAACEWQQLLSTPHNPTIQVILLPTFRFGYAECLAQSLPVGCFNHYGMRGPPAQIS